MSLVFPTTHSPPPRNLQLSEGACYSLPHLFRIPPAARAGGEGGLLTWISSGPPPPPFFFFFFFFFFVQRVHPSKPFFDSSAGGSLPPSSPSPSLSPSAAVGAGRSRSRSRSRSRRRSRGCAKLCCAKAPRTLAPSYLVPGTWYLVPGTLVLKTDPKSPLQRGGEKDTTAKDLAVRHLGRRLRTRATRRGAGVGELGAPAAPRHSLRPRPRPEPAGGVARAPARGAGTSPPRPPPP